jgi:hypothetical protein
MPRLGPAVLAVFATVAAPGLAFSSEPRQLALAVADAQGQFVADLWAEDVRVLENGEARVFRTQAYDAVWAFVSGLPAGSKCTLWTTGDPGGGQGARRVEVRIARPGVRWRVSVDSP